MTLGHGKLGHLAPSHADWEKELGQGEENFTYPTFKVLVVLYLFYLRVNIADAKNNGEKCAKLRIIELEETDICNVICSPPTPAPAPGMVLKKRFRKRVKMLVFS